MESSPGPLCYYCRVKFENLDQAFSHSLDKHSNQELCLFKEVWENEKRKYVAKHYKKRTCDFVNPHFDNDSWVITEKDDLTVCDSFGKLSVNDVSTQTDRQNTPTIDIKHLDAEDQETIYKLLEFLPSFSRATRNTDYLQQITNFITLVSNGRFPIDNISCQLFFDVIKWYSSPSIFSMRYSNEVKKFWAVGFKIFKGRFLRFMGGFKTIGQSEGTERAIERSKVNFIAPHVNVCRQEVAKSAIDCKCPGILTKNIENFATLCGEKFCKIAVDGKKISSGFGKLLGDADLYGHESNPTLLERKARLKSELEMITDAENDVEKFESLHRLSTGTLDFAEKFNLADSIIPVITVISHRIRELRELKLKREFTLSRLKDSVTGDWKKTKFAFAISAVQTSIFRINDCIQRLLHSVDETGLIASLCNGTSKNFSEDRRINLGSQENYVCLTGYHEQYLQDNDVPLDMICGFIKQRSSEWHAIRNKARATGSTLYKAIGLDTLKKQLQFFEEKIEGKVPQEISEASLSAMRYGTDNEVNAIATLVGKFLPVFEPEATFFEEGCHLIRNEGQILLVVSPDGSGKDTRGTTKMAFEFKCPIPGKSFKTDVHYSIPKYYIFQVLSEMKVLHCDVLYYLSYTPDSTAVLKVLFDDELWDLGMQVLIDTYGGETPKKPKRLHLLLKQIHQKLNEFREKNVEFVAEMPSLIADACTGHHRTDPLVVHGYHTPDQTSCRDVSLVIVREILYRAKQNLENAYNLLRIPAKEVLVAVISDLDRIQNSEIPYAVPVSYCLPGYSLKPENLRSLLLDLLRKCMDYGVRVPVVSFDGQFYNLAVRDANGKPLTVLQLAKDVWSKARKMSKAEQVRMFGEANCIGQTSRLKLNDIQERAGVEVNYNVGKFGPIIVKGLKDKQLKPMICPPDISKFMANGKKSSDFVIDNGKSCYDGLDLMADRPEDKMNDQIPDEVFASMTNENNESTMSDMMKDICDLSLSSGMEHDTTDIALMLEPKLNECAMLSSVNQISEDNVMDDMDALSCATTEHDTIFNETEIMEMQQEVESDELECSNEALSNNEVVSDDTELEFESDMNMVDHQFPLDNTHFSLMLGALRQTVTKHRKKMWECMSTETFREKFSTVQSIRTSFTAYELRLCVEAIKDTLSVEISKDSKKGELVQIFSRKLDIQHENNRSKKARSPRKLKIILKDMFSRKFNKMATNVITATNEFLNSLETWQKGNRFGKSTSIDNEEYIWYSKPEYVSTMEMDLFSLLDCHHIFVNARCKICSQGINSMGISREAWVSVAKQSNENKTGLTLSMVEDLVDRQSNAFAQTTFSEKVEREMTTLGWQSEAEFCRDIRNWYRAEDEPGLSAKERHCLRLNMRERLLKHVNFACFPPPGTHVCGMPIVMFEGILTNIDRRIQLYRIVESYNVRSLGTLDSENFFSAFQDLDPKGTGVLMPDDIPVAMESASYIYQTQIDAERPFFFRTTAAKVYPLHERLVVEMNKLERTNRKCDTDNTDDRFYEISLRDHAFDNPSNRKRKPKRKRGSISSIDLPSRGTQGVRQYHKNDESKILPHKRLGIEINN